VRPATQTGTQTQKTYQQHKTQSNNLFQHLQQVNKAKPFKLIINVQSLSVEDSKSLREVTVILPSKTWINIPLPKCSPYPISTPKPNPTHNLSLKLESNDR